MVAAITPIAGLTLFMPIIAFLFIFVVVYALLEKTKVLGGTQWLHLFVSFLMAIFFVVNASLVDFVRFNASWFGVFLVCLVFIMILISFTHGKIDWFTKPWVGWVLVVGLIVFFIISSSYVFNWAISLDAIGTWFDSKWIGFIVLLIVTLIASWILTKKK